MNRPWPLVVVMVTALVAVLAGGCSASVHARRAENDGKMEGMAFRVRAPYTVRVYQLRKGANPRKPAEYQQVLAKTMDLPDPDSVYALDVRADAFAQRRVEVRLNEDGTLQSVKVDATDRTGEIASAAGKQATAAAGALTGFEAQRRKAEVDAIRSDMDLAKARREAEEAARAPAAEREAATIAYQEALNTVSLLEFQLEATEERPENAEKRAQIAGALRLARLRANTAARDAGRPPPYPAAAP